MRSMIYIDKSQRNLQFKWYKMGYKVILLFFAVFCFIQTNNAQDVRLEINAKTRAICFEGKWKAGKQLQIVIKDYTAKSFDSLVVSYSGGEYVNTRGIETFSDLSAGPKVLESTSEYFLLPVMIQEKDYAHVTITLYRTKDSAGNNITPAKIDEQVYTYRVSGGLKFDVSTGAFVSGLRNEAYALNPVSDSTNQIVAERRGSARVGTGILAHLHTRCNFPVNIGLSGGFEINADARIGYLAGVSLFLGYDRKFVISGGVVASKKNELSNVYMPNEIIRREITAVPMVEVWAGGWFWGLSYNF